jgi:hypothetical protein
MGHGPRRRAPTPTVGTKPSRSSTCSMGICSRSCFSSIPGMECVDKMIGMGVDVPPDQRRGPGIYSVGLRRPASIYVGRLPAPAGTSLGIRGHFISQAMLRPGGGWGVIENFPAPITDRRATARGQLNRCTPRLVCYNHRHRVGTLLGTGAPRSHSRVAQ